jgi:F420-0:gamma-glutamyl ligase
MGKAAKVPVVAVRGAKLGRGGEGARRLIRPAQEDMFR